MMTRNEAQSKHAILAAEIRRHDRAYYVDANPLITDQDYDRLYRSLLDLENQFPELITSDSPSQRVGGQPIDSFRSVTHGLPMMSLDNTYSQMEVREFVARVQRILPNEHLQWTLEPKIDGVAVSLRYEQGFLTVAATRGDGATGDDVTANLRTLRSLPLRLSVLSKSPDSVSEPNLASWARESRPLPAVLEVRGEVFMSRDGFRKLNEDRVSTGEEPFANARNATAGTLKQLDPRIAASRPLDAIFYGIGLTEGIQPPPRQDLLLQWLHQLGLRTPSRCWVCDSADALIEALRELDGFRRSLPYETDGAVIKLNAIALRQTAGQTAKAPRWAIAYKYAPERAETRLKAITIQVGRTGALTPVAELEPVLLAGSTVSRATLHNEDEIRRKDVRVGDMVRVEKAGEVIPAVVEVVLARRPADSQPFSFPRRCPECGSAAVRDGDRSEGDETKEASPQTADRRPTTADKKLTCLHYDLAFKDSSDNSEASERGEKRGLGDGLGADGASGESWEGGEGETGAVWRCANPDCRAQVRGRLQHWCARGAMDIEGAGESLIQQLVQRGLVLEVADFYRLTADEVAALERMGEKSANNLIAGIAASKSRDLWRVVFGLGILHVGATVAKALARRFPSMSAILDATRTELEAVEDVGEVVASSIVRWCEDARNKDLIARLERAGVNLESSTYRQAAAAGPFAGKVFVLTGTLPNLTREKATALIEERGGRISGSVSKKTDYLLAGDDAGSKLEKARKLGITILSEPEFLSRIDFGGPSAGRPR